MRLVARALPKTPLDIEQLAEYCDRAAKLMWAPSMMKWRGRIVDGETMDVEFSHCFAVNGLRQTGGLEHYRCSCPAVREGWFEALGIAADQEIIRTMRDGANSCLIRVRLKG